MSALPFPLCAPLDHPWLLLLVPVPALLVLLWPRAQDSRCCARARLSLADAGGLQECASCHRFRLIWEIGDRTYTTGWMNAESRERAHPYEPSRTIQQSPKGRSH